MRPWAGGAVLVTVLATVLVIALSWSGLGRAGDRATTRRPGAASDPGPPRPARSEPRERSPDHDGPTPPTPPPTGERPDTDIHARFEGPIPARRLATRTDLLILTDERRVALDYLVLENDANHTWGIPMDDFLARVRAETGIPGLCTATPVPLFDRIILAPRSRTTARELLDTFARSAGVAWTVAWGTLLIHDRDAEPPYPGIAALYPVADLRGVTCESIRREVAPWSWDEYGAEVSVEAGGDMVFAQTIPPVQDELARRLAELRAAVEAHPGPAEAEAPAWEAPAATGAARSR